MDKPLAHIRIRKKDTVNICGVKYDGNTGFHFYADPPGNEYSIGFAKACIDGGYIDRRGNKICKICVDHIYNPIVDQTINFGE